VIPRFSIIPAVDARLAAELVLAMAEEDACILHLDRGPLGQTLVFCPSPRFARAEALRFERSARIAAGLCALTLALDGAIAVEGGGSDESSGRLASFVGRILRDLGPCRVADDETGEDLTAHVARSPRLLFASLGGDGR
jgi:hypothetical protein